MSKLSDNQVDSIARKVLERIAGGGSGLSQTQQGSVARGGALPAGVFRSIDECVAAAREAFQAFSAIGLDQRKDIIATIRASMRDHAEDLAQEAVAETGLGRVDNKIIKNLLVTNKTPGPEELEPVAWTGDHGLTLMERAPFGVIAAITPTTNPTSRNSSV